MRSLSINQPLMAFLLPTMHSLKSFTKMTSLNSCLVVRSGHHYHSNVTAVAPNQEIFKSLPEVTQFTHGGVRLRASILLCSDYGISCLLLYDPRNIIQTMTTETKPGTNNSAHLVVSSKEKCQSWPSASIL